MSHHRHQQRGEHEAAVTDAIPSLGKSTIYTATTDGVVVVDGEVMHVRAGDVLPYPLAHVITARFGRHPRG